jgi:hypothetical protein
MEVSNQFHPSIEKAFTFPTLTDGETAPIREALAILQSRLAAVPSLAHFEVALVPNAVAREAESTLAYYCTGQTVPLPQSPH